MRAALDAERETVPEFWAALCEPGWLGLHVDEANGGAGYGFVEQAVVLEELGRAAAPGPYTPDGARGRRAPSGRRRRGREAPVQDRER